MVLPGLLRAIYRLQGCSFRKLTPPLEGSSSRGAEEETGEIPTQHLPLELNVLRTQGTPLPHWSPQDLKCLHTTTGSVSALFLRGRQISPTPGPGKRQRVASEGFIGQGSHLSGSLPSSFHSVFWFHLMILSQGGLT